METFRLLSEALGLESNSAFGGGFGPVLLVALAGYLIFSALVFATRWVYRVAFEPTTNYRPFEIEQTEAQSSEITLHVDDVPHRMQTGDALTVTLREGAARRKVTGVLYRGKKPNVEPHKIKMPSHLAAKLVGPDREDRSGPFELRFAPSHGLWNSPIPEIKISTRTTFWVTVLTTLISIAIELTSRAIPADETMIEGLAIAPEITGGYDPDEWMTGWKVEDCLDARQRVFIAQSLEPVTMDGCKVASGRWIDPYTNDETTNSADLEIDHVVSLKEAHASGGFAWPTEKKRQYAQDLTDGAVFAVLGTTNGRKKQQDPSKWLPLRHDLACRYLRNYLAVKRRWGLTADPAEADSIRLVAKSCAQ